MTIWHGMIKLVEVKKFNKDMAVADKDNRDNSIRDRGCRIFSDKLLLKIHRC